VELPILAGCTCGADLPDAINELAHAGAPSAAETTP